MMMKRSSTNLGLKRPISPLKRKITMLQEQKQLAQIAKDKEAKHAEFAEIA